jgi:hypothetical protein
MSEAGKSDIATVCSGSVTEDIDTLSVDMNVPQALPNNIIPSPHSDRVVLMPGSILRRSVEFAPSSFTPFYKQVATDSAVAVPHTSTDQTEKCTSSTSQSPMISTPPSCSRWNDMGPPLSRALLMQSLQSTAGSATGSRAGSVKSYGSNTGASQNSDVMAHVDPDDCGGSLMGSITDGQSVHSQEDIRSGTDAELHDHHHHRGPISKDEDEEEVKQSSNGTHPFLKDGASGQNSNGRTSPGGTIYRGKGVRRYQGRYMNLPLQRFRQDADDDLLDTYLESDKVMEEKNQQRNSGYGFEDDWRRSQSPMCKGQDGRYRGRGRSPSPVRKNGYHEKSGNNNITNGNSRRGSAHHHHRSRSRSTSADGRRPPARRKRWNRLDDTSPRNNNNNNSRWGSRTHGRHNGSPGKSPTNSSVSSGGSSNVAPPARSSPRRRKRPISQSRGRT